MVNIIFFSQLQNVLRTHNSIKILSAILLICISYPSLMGQVSLDVQGFANSDTTVAVINVRSNTIFKDIVGLYVNSNPTPGRGIAGYFNGGSVGLKAMSTGTGLLGIGTNAYGVRGESISSSGAFFKGATNRFDITLGGSSYAGSGGNDEGVIGVTGNSGDLWFVSNDGIVMELDDNDDEAGHLYIRNGEDNIIFEVDENGTISSDGHIRADGILQSDSLKGDHTQLVYADTNGNLVKNVHESIIMVSPGEFIPVNISPNASAYKFDYYNKTAFAPINVPNGVTITKIDVIYSDLNDNVEVSMCFQKLILDQVQSADDQLISCANSVTIMNPSINIATLSINEKINNGGLTQYRLKINAHDTVFQSYFDYVVVHGFRIFYHF